jgi:AcrR family transcriptional regulator
LSEILKVTHSEFALQTGTVPYTVVPALSSPQRLPTGRHRLTREDVARSQRDRLLVAMLHSVADRGYSATTVADVVAQASVSRSTFYAQFADKEACFIAAYGFAMEYALEQISTAAAALPAELWRERVRSDLATYLELLASEPELAITLHVEVLAAGPAALEHRAEMLGLLASNIANFDELARGSNPSLPPLPPAVFALYTGGLDELIRDRLRTASPAALRELIEPVLEATYALLGSASPMPSTT